MDSRPYAQTSSRIGDALRARDGVRLLYIPTSPELGVVAGGCWELRLHGARSCSAEGITHFTTRARAVAFLRSVGCAVDCYGKVSYAPTSISPASSLTHPRNLQY